MSFKLKHFFGLVMLFCCVGAQGATLEVPADYDSIQDAIDDAEAGDIIEVDIGIYRENLILVGGIEVRSLEAAGTFLIAADDSLPIVTIANVDDVFFRNFTLVESTAGITVLASSNIIIANNVFDFLDGNAVRITTGTEIELLNNVFWRNSVAVERLVETVAITNNIFAENTDTFKNGSLVDPDINISYNCFESIERVAGSNETTGLPAFVNSVGQDFHLRQTSVCIDMGDPDGDDDIIDDTIADMGAYGGQYADVKPYPVEILSATDASTSAPDVFNIELDWSVNQSYMTTREGLPGSYNIYYALNHSGPVYDGTDADGNQLESPINVVGATSNSTTELSYIIPDLQPTASPGTPTLQTPAPQNESVVLNWTAVADATSYSVHYGEAAVSENTLAVGNQTQYTVTGLENDVEYIFAVNALIQPVYYLSVTALDSTNLPTHQSDFAAEVDVPVGEPVEGALSNVVSGIPEVVQPYPNLPDEGCFIATAAFGADWVAEVQVLRDFRDRYLLSTETGRAFVSWYYEHGPVWAHWLNAHADWKPLVRALLWPLVVLATFMLGTAGVIKIFALLGLMLAVSLLLYQRRRIATGRY